MDGKQWMPVEDYEFGAKLPDHLRLCQLSDAPAPPAWGPPQEQPDSEGWWAFEGEFCLSVLMEAAHVKTIHLFESDDLDAEILGLYNGTFRKLLADPWEVSA